MARMRVARWLTTALRGRDLRSRYTCSDQLRYAQTLPVLIAAAVLLMSMTLAAGLVAEHISRRR